MFFENFGGWVKGEKGAIAGRPNVGNTVRKLDNELGGRGGCG